MRSEPTAAVRARAALREVKGMRAGKWPGDAKFERYGPTLLDRYEALAKELLRFASDHETRGYG